MRLFQHAMLAFRICELDMDSSYLEHTHKLWLDPWRMMLGIHLLSGASVLTAHCCSEVTLAPLMPWSYYIHRALKNHDGVSGHSAGNQRP